MRARLGFLVGLALSAGALPAAAQRTTEQFIPLGRSPGVSGVMAYLGTISALDPAGQAVTISGPQGEVTVRVTDTTRMWMDRSGQGQPPVPCHFEDLRVGWRAEVKYLDRAKKEGAEWLKVAPG